MAHAPQTPSPSGATDISALAPRDIIARRDSYAKRVSRLRRALEYATSRLDALNGVIAEFNLEPAGKRPPESVPSGDVDAIRGKSLRQALIVLAERHDGVLQSGAARRALEAAEVVNVPMPPNRLWKEITLIRRFKKLHRGTYKLLPEEPKTPQLWTEEEEAELDAVAAARHQERLEREDSD